MKNKVIIKFFYQIFYLKNLFQKKKLNLLKVIFLTLIFAIFLANFYNFNKFEQKENIEHYIKYELIENSDTDLKSEIKKDVKIKLRIFSTSRIHDGNLGGSLGADNLCNSDPAKPNDGSTYKELLGTIKREATSNNWPLLENTEYYQLNDERYNLKGLLIGKTNEFKVFNFPLSNNVGYTIPGYFPFTYTGLDGIMNANLDNNCSNFTSSEEQDSGLLGNYLNTNSKAFSSEDASSCNGKFSIYCVEQKVTDTPF